MSVNAPPVTANLFCLRHFSFHTLWLCWGNMKIWTITPNTYGSQTHNTYAYLIFSFSLLFCSLSFLPGPQRQQRMTIASFVTIKRNPCTAEIILLSSYHFVSWRTIYQYQVVRNQRTPLVLYIVEIVLDLVTPSPFKHACCTYFCYKDSPSRINCTQFWIQFLHTATLNKDFNIWSFEPDTQLDTLSSQLSCELIESSILQLAIFNVVC